MFTHLEVQVCAEDQAVVHSCLCQASQAAISDCYTVLQTKRGINICATIHCPPPDTFELFAAVLVLQQGNVVYFGRNGQPCEAYFSGLQVLSCAKCT